MPATAIFSYFILLVTALCATGAVVCAQDKNSGHVVIHTDPRLAVLMKKNHTLPQPVIAMAAPLKATSEAAPAKVTATAAIATPAIPSATAAKIAAVNNNNKTPVIPPAANAPRPVPNIPIQPPTKNTNTAASRTYHGKGFRVQIYYGSDRAKALAVKTQFNTHFPGVHSYITYSSPNFRVRVGNYRNRTDAEGMLREANSMYNPSMIVPDEVAIDGN